MNIGIIVHTLTGNTYLVAEKLQEKLETAGHSVKIERITVAGGEQPNNPKFQLENAPEVSSYDALVFGAPVRGFSLSPIMAAYLKQLSSLSGKKTVCFVTKLLPFSWTGGNGAVAQMKRICESKGATVYATGIVNWKKPQPDSRIIEVVEHLGNLFHK